MTQDSNNNLKKLFNSMLLILVLEDQSESRLTVKPFQVNELDKAIEELKSYKPTPEQDRYFEMGIGTSVNRVVKEFLNDMGDYDEKEVVLVAPDGTEFKTIVTMENIVDFEELIDVLSR